MARRPTLTEASLAAHVVKWLEWETYSVYQEVTAPTIYDKSRVDIVAEREGDLWAIETKLHLSFDVIAQAERWLNYAHRVSIAVPEAKHTTGRACAIRCARALGIGVLTVKSLWPNEAGSFPANYPITIRSALLPRESITSGLLASLRPEHQTHSKAGTNAGGHFTRFRQTCDALRAHAEKFPGSTLRSALSVIDHHYASIASGVWALSTLAVGKLQDRGIAIRVVDGQACLFLADRAPSLETPQEAKLRRRAARREELKRRRVA